MALMRIASLGGVCQVSYQIKKRFGFHVTSPFDWLVTPLSSIGKIFDDDGVQFGEDVSILMEQTAVCKRYGVGYQHEFPRNSKRYPVIDKESLKTCKEKLTYKYNKFRKTLSDDIPTLLVRVCGHHNNPLPTPYVTDSEILSVSDLNNFVEIIRKKFPYLPFELAFAYYPKFTMLNFDFQTLHKSITLFALEQTTSDWHGDDQGWNNIFQKFDLDIHSSGQAIEEEILYE